MPEPEKRFETTDIGLATALLCTEYVVETEQGYEVVRNGGTFVLLSTDVIDVEAGRCQFTIAYGDEELEEFTTKSVAFRANRLWVSPRQYDRRKKPIVDAMRREREAVGCPVGKPRNQAN